jgi:hypothetical protein
VAETAAYFFFLGAFLAGFFAGIAFIPLSVRSDLPAIRAVSSRKSGEGETATPPSRGAYFFFFVAFLAAFFLAAICQSPLSVQDRYAASTHRQHLA